MKNNTPTIEKFIKQGLIEGLGVDFEQFKEENPILYSTIKAIVLKSTKFHVKAQQEAIKKQLEEGLETFGVSLTDDFKLEQTGNCLIDNAYPLENIK